MQNVWIVYYAFRNMQTEIIGIVKSEQDAKIMIKATNDHETVNGWDNYSLKYMCIPFDTNLVISGEDGPLSLT
uniref:Uncharacterized protein n=1 Tax=viral metagenome TaxID=1070528 RepID=A0A6C0JTU4_9ZZZZ